jgi:hypothetical protein
VAARGSELRGRWFDHEGKPITPFFRIADGLSYGSFPSDVRKRLVVRAVSGGGAVVARDGVWEWFLPSATTTVQTAPAWLAQNPQTDFTLVRDARGSVIAAGGTGECRKTVWPGLLR